MTETKKILQAIFFALIGFIAGVLIAVLFLNKTGKISDPPKPLYCSNKKRISRCENEKYFSAYPCSDYIDEAGFQCSTEIYSAGERCSTDKSRGGC